MCLGGLTCVFWGENAKNKCKGNKQKQILGMTTRKAKVRQKRKQILRLTGSRKRWRFFGSERPRQVLRYQPPANGLFWIGSRQLLGPRSNRRETASNYIFSIFSQGVHRYGLPSL